MSNHDIGHAMSPMLKNIMEMRDAGELTDNATQTILKYMNKLLNYVDGNTGEAFYEVNRLYCGYCGKRMQYGEPLYDRFSYHMRHNWDYKSHTRLENKYFKYAEYLCEDCFRKYISDSGYDDTDSDDEMERQRADSDCVIAGDIDLRRCF